MGGLIFCPPVERNGGTINRKAARQTVRPFPFQEDFIVVNNSDAPARLLSIVAAANSLGVSRNTVFALLSSGKLGYVRIGRRRLVPADAIENFIAANLVAKQGHKGARVA